MSKKFPIEAISSIFGSKKHSMTKQIIELDFGTIEYDGVIASLTLYPRTHLTLNMAMEMVKIRKEISGNSNVKLFADIRNIIGIDKKAREYLKSDEAKEYAICCAFLVESTLSIFLGNLFLRIFSSDTPLKMFRDMDKVHIWLKKF